MEAAAAMGMGGTRMWSVAVTGVDIDDLLLTTFSTYTSDKHGCLLVEMDMMRWDGYNHGAFRQMLGLKLGRRKLDFRVFVHVLY